ncbi:MAG: helix-turn-helix transcriptional regulator [Armatimonadetes bacterium]|nr:helix-turn-helix transcriptional regulator [Armatimonadota bacterium]
MNHPTFSGYGHIINRFGDVMDHVDKFAFKGVGRLAEASLVSPSTISRLINNQINPSFALIARVTAAIEKELGMRIDPRDLIAEEGKFLTPSVCNLTACPGCLPESAVDEFGDTKQRFQGVLPGTWVTSRYPKGFQEEKGGR